MDIYRGNTSQRSGTVIPMTLREFILYQMELRSIESASAFAELVDVSKNTILRALEEPRTHEPSIEFMIKLSRATKVDLRTIVQICYPDEVQEAQINPSSLVTAQEIEELPEEGRFSVKAVIKAFRDWRNPKDTHQ